jgi:hypothetical protein
MLIDKECVPPAVLTQQQQQPQQHHQPQAMPQAAGYMYPMTHMPYPHLQIYPPAVSSPLAQPHLPTRTASPSRVHRAPNRQSGLPTGAFKRSTTMYWDEPQQPLGAASYVGNSANHAVGPPPIERRRSGDLPTSMSRMTLNGGPPAGRERRESGLTRPDGARRHGNGER